MPLLVATTNPDKLEEIRRALEGFEAPLETLAAFPEVDPPEETGLTFAENARLKARYYALATGLVTVAEDSGLEIDEMNRMPGVHSARYGGVKASYPDRFRIIYEALRVIGRDTSTARFVCALALDDGQRVLFETQGDVEGTVAAAPIGASGFGYDPIFFYPPYGRTFAQLTREEKLGVSHRGRAFRALKQFLASAAIPQIQKIRVT